MAGEKLIQTNKRKTNAADESLRQKRARKTFENSLPEDDELVAGKIKRIFMKNFMCHDAMEVNLNPRVNFIVGANGSGKSAILTALTVGLGARAKITNRGPSIKEFIKKGKNACSIEISITNDGPMAYKHENYGNVITVVRSITQAASSYKIKNWRGDVISTKREELDNIIDQLNIQVDNPISVLNQDVSRTFLSTTDSGDKYKLFMKATKLDVIGENYRKASESSELTKQELTEARKHLSENEKEIKQIQKKLKALESLDKTREEYTNVKKELLWAIVDQEEKKLLDIDTKIQNQEDNVEKLKNLETSKAAKEQEINAKIDELKNEIAQRKSEAADSEAKLNEVKKKFTEAKKIHESKKEKLRTINELIRRKETDIITLQDGISKLEQAKNADERQKITDEIQKCEQNLAEIIATLSTKQNELMHLEENQMRIDQEYNAASIDIEQKRINLDKLQRKLTAFKNQSSDALMVYGSNMPRLLRRIEEEHKRGRFKHKPIGPVGYYIKLKDSKWIPAVENHLGFGTITLFCVDNVQDNRILNVIINEVFGRDRPPQVVISKFFDEMHNVSEGCIKTPRYSNLLDAMEISNPVIANSLIDQKEVECTLLIPTSDEACDVMDEERKVPRNTKRAITMNADLFFPDPNYRTYGGSVSRPKFLQVSTNEAIQSLREEIDVAENEYRLAQEQSKLIRDKKQSNAQQLAEVKTQVKNLQKNQQTFCNKLDKLKDDIEKYNDENINTFKTELEELERFVAEKKEERSHMVADLNESKKLMNAFNDECKNQRDLQLNLDAILQPFMEHIKELKDEKNRLNVSNQGAARRMEEARQILQKLQGEHQQQQRVVNSKIDTAENSCPRINTRKSINDLNNRLKELKLMIESMEKEHGSTEELTKKLEEKQQKFADIQDFAIELQRSNDKQIERLRKRKEFYNKMKKVLSEIVDDSFKNILSLRNYKGKIIIDHHNKNLTLKITPQSNSKQSIQDAKALSGGERSYSTVAFILALWSSTSLPFYFLDEFDVFMDKINRRVIMDILLEHAQSNPQSQFAFLTPLDTSHIIAENSITIHRLAPPQRSA